VFIIIIVIVHILRLIILYIMNLLLFRGPMRKLRTGVQIRVGGVDRGPLYSPVPQPGDMKQDISLVTEKERRSLIGLNSIAQPLDDMTHCKKRIAIFPVLSQDVTNQTLPGRD
jgi:hypothetical protein